MEDKKERILCIGDLHGNYKGFKQVLERCNFNNDIDILISLGDVVDGHCDSFEVVEELLKIKNLIAIKGNHDDWFNMWIESGNNPSGWLQGQKATGDSYVRNLINKDLDLYDYSTGTKRVRLTTAHLPQTHIEFFKNQLPYYIDNDNNIFVHGGFNRYHPVEEQDDILWWDRDLWSQALSYGRITAVEGIQRPRFKMVGDYKEVFIGHTSTQFWKEDVPMNAANIWNLDTGGGLFGKVSIMDINTKEFWQSDTGKELYPEFKGR
jgi:serine/threonine protein phosphatase 1